MATKTNSGSSWQGEPKNFPSLFYIFPQEIHISLENGKLPFIARIFTEFPKSDRVDVSGLMEGSLKHT